MSVLIETISVIIKVSEIISRFGKLENFENQVKDIPHCCDGDLFRVGFFNRDETNHFANWLCKVGFQCQGSMAKVDFAIIDMMAGFLYPCDWLKIRIVPDEYGNLIEVGSLLGGRSTQIALPAGWMYSESITLTHLRLNKIDRIERFSKIKQIETIFSGLQLLGEWCLSAVAIHTYNAIDYFFRKEEIRQRKYFPQQPSICDDDIKALIGYSLHHIRGMCNKQETVITVHHWNPLIEHFSFEYGNQFYFVYIEVDGKKFHHLSHLERNHFYTRSKFFNAIPCVMPMIKQENGSFIPLHPGWGLFNARTLKKIKPYLLCTPDLIERSQSTLHYMAVRFAAKDLQHSGKEVLGYVGYEGYTPSIWTKDEDGYQWHQVLAVNYPFNPIIFPHDIAEIEASVLANESNPTQIKEGNIINITASSEHQTNTIDPLPLYRNSRVSASISQQPVKDIIDAFARFDHCDDQNIYDIGPLTQEDALKAFATMFNTKSTNAIKDLLDEEFVYSTQFTDDPIKTRVKFLEHMNNKFKMHKAKGTKVFAEMGTVVYRSSKRHCVILALNNKSNIDTVAVATTENGLIKDIELCQHPRPEMATRSGIYPGL